MNIVEHFQSITHCENCMKAKIKLDFFCGRTGGRVVTPEFTRCDCGAWLFSDRQGNMLTCTVETWPCFHPKLQHELKLLPRADWPEWEDADE